MKSGWMDTLVQEVFARRVSAWYDPWNTVDNRSCPFRFQRLSENGIQTGRSRQSGGME